MEVTKLPDIIYHLQITLSEQDLTKMEAYVESGPAYNGYHEFRDLIKLIRKSVGNKC